MFNYTFSQQEEDDHNLRSTEMARSQLAAPSQLWQRFGTSLYVRDASSWQFVSSNPNAAHVVDEVHVLDALLMAGFELVTTTRNEVDVVHTLCRYPKTRSKKRSREEGEED